MTTPVPVIIERGGGGGFPIEVFLIMFIVGIVAVAGFLGWMGFRYQNKKLGGVQLPTGAAATPTEPYLLGIMLTKTGEWDIRVKGQRYRALEAVPDEKTRRQVVAALKELAGFSRGYIQKDHAGSPAAAEAAPVAPPLSVAGLSQPAPARAGASPASSSQPLASRLLARSTAAPAEPARPAAEPPLAAPPAPALRPKPSDEPRLKRSSGPALLMPTIDLAREIGDIVAAMQAQRPDLSARSIKLLNAASGGIDFTIDGLTYGSLDEIPDAAVRELIQAAIKEWERR